MSGDARNAVRLTRPIRVAKPAPPSVISQRHRWETTALPRNAVVDTCDPVVYCGRARLKYPSIEADVDIANGAGQTHLPSSGCPCPARWT